MVAALWGPASAAQAGVYTDDLSKCLVAHVSPSDQTAFMTWIFSAISAHPAIQTYSQMTGAQRDAAIAKAGGLMQRLVTVDCRTETVTAIKYEGDAALGSAFGVVGQVAMRNLFTDPNVALSMEKLSSSVDKAKIGELREEAGLPKAASPPK